MKKVQQKAVLNWFRANLRPLPWRKTSEPYKVWISEVMLQQTTSAAVIPYYHKFLKRFPNLKSLASANIEDVYEFWSGLGYYSRARNLHKCAEILMSQYGGEFPSSHTELIKLPGFGPYTSRAVSSIANNEPVGVLDGNVIRVLSRVENKKTKWWETKARNQLQEMADQWVQGVKSSEMNQALMEIGSTICLPKSPKCLLCPMMKMCKAQKLQSWQSLPLKKPKRKKELWLWTAKIRRKAGKIYFIKNNYAPFLKNSWFPEGKAHKVEGAPDKYDFRHTITHHEIYVRIEDNKANIKNSEKGEWVLLDESRKHAPASLVQKAINYAMETKA